MGSEPSLPEGGTRPDPSVGTSSASRAVPSASPVPSVPPMPPLPAELASSPRAAGLPVPPTLPVPPGQPVPPGPPAPPVAPGPSLLYASAGDRGQTLHPLTVAVGAVRAVKNLSWAIVLLLLLRAFGRQGATFELAVAAFGGLQVFGSLMRYLTLRYRIEPGASPTLVIESGLVFRQRRAIPVARVQNINIKRDLAHRLFGVAELEVETAAGREAEASLSALSAAEAQRLREQLLSLQQKRPASEAPAGHSAEVVYAAGVGDLLLAGATRTRVGAVVGGVLGVFYFVADLVGDERETWSLLLLPTRKMAWLTDSLTAGLPPEVVAVLAALAVAALAVLAGWLVSIATTLVLYWKFTLLETTDGRLLRRFGLLTVNELAFPRQRLQKLTIDSPLLQRKLGLCQVTAVTAASFEDRQDAGQSMLAPITRAQAVEGLCRRVLPGFALSSVRWQRVSPKAKRRWTVRNSVWLTLLTIVPLSVFVSPWAVAGLPAVVGLAAWLAQAQYRTTKYALENGLVIFRNGVLTRRVRVVPQSRVQLSVVRASPMQRLLRLADLKVYTAAQPTAADAHLPNLPADVAVRIQDELLRPATPQVAEGAAR